MPLFRIAAWIPGEKKLMGLKYLTEARLLISSSLLTEFSAIKPFKSSPVCRTKGLTSAASILSPDLFGGQICC